VSFDLESQAQVLSNGYILNATGGVLLRALPQLDFELLPSFVFTAGEPRYTGTLTPTDQYIFGNLDAKSIGTTLRATYTFTPRLTLQTYGQLFLASGHYDRFSFFQANAPGEKIRLDALQPFNAPLASNPDFEEGILNLNVVLRWEYTLGSTIYLVYTRSQVPAVSLLPGESANLSLNPVSRAPAADVVLLKVTYFWAG
jgi:hypothetical protein